MLSTSLLPIFLLSLAITPAFGLSCYSYNDYEDKASIIHGMQFCTAIYEVADHQATFGGGDRHPSRVSNIWNMAKGKDCQLQHVENNMGEPNSDMYLCYCFTSLCNFPFQFDEFAKRGFTLAPLYKPHKDI